MIRRVTGILLILILLAAENPIILVNLGGAEEHQPTSVELDALVREIELGIPPEGPLSDREFLMPEGVSIDDVRILSILSKMGEEYVGREDAAETIVEAGKRV
ncbi:MAG: hypothetical protein QXO76_04850, partial [Thermoproteota archaeon]